MVCPIAVRLVDENGAVDDLALNPDGLNGLVLQDLDLGYPSVRVSSDVRTERDGTDDATRYFGARLVSVRAVAQAVDGSTKQQVLDALGYFTVPSRRPWLYYTLEDGGPERRVRLRAEAFTAPLAAPVAHRLQRLQVSWAGPDGVLEAAELTVENVFAAADVEDGRTYDLTFDRSYPESDPIGTVEIVNDGNVDVSPVLRLYGPCTNPRIENVTYDETLEFTANTGLSIAAGDYLEVDVLNSTALLNGDAAASRYGRLDIAESTWWTLRPGVNVVRYYPETFETGSLAEVRYRSQWI